MDQNLQAVIDLIQADVNLSKAEKAAIVTRLNNADKKMTVDAFRIDRGEHLKKTMSVLLDETIEELEQKRKAVEEKNRDLEIEAALERVRTVAMGMRAANDLLNICKALFNELQLLQFGDLRNAIIHTYDNGKDYFVDYDYSDFTKGTINHIPYSGNSILEKFVKDIRKTRDAFTEIEITGDDLKKWKTFRDANNEAPDERLSKNTSLYYYIYSVGDASIGISTFVPISTEKLELLKRFRNVFDLAYRRYADIQLAEAQAREARLETALERVRAVAMAMKKADELIGVCEVTYNELKELGFHNIRNAQIAIPKDDNGFYYAFEYSDHSTIRMREAHISINPLLKEFSEAMEKSKDAFFQKQISGKEFDDWRVWRKGISSADDPRVAGANSLCFYFFSIGAGSLGISSYDPISTDQLATLKRFKKVFELSYTRFTDVAQAEAQAREAQIELGLERVRARAMAMQNSGELSDLVTTVFNELSKLDFALSACIINIIDGDSRSNTVWFTGVEEGMALQSFHMKFEDYPYHDAMWDAWKAKKTKYVYTLHGQEKLTYDDYLLNETEFSRISDAAKTGLRAMDQYVCSFTFCNFGGLQTVGTEALSDASLDILSRFGKVFDLTYTRFNDLKQAETQAREAQIELALERVRARTMAMQHSEELAETAFILFQQFKELGENPDQATIGIINEEEHVIEYWVTMYGSQINKVFKFSIDEPHVTRKIYKAWKAKKKSLVIDLSGKALVDFGKYRESMGGARLKKDEKRRVINVALFSKGLINVQSNEARSEESIRLLERFAGVFEGTYTRFLDLKKSEAQVRESQIELALERVRARTMAMQHSDELPETAAVLFQQFRDLGEHPIQATIGIVNEAEGVIEFSVTDWRGGGSQIAGSFNGSIEEPTLLNKEYTAWKAKKKSLVVDLTGQELQDWIAYRNVWSNTIARSDDTYGRRVVSFAFFSKGHISISTGEPPPGETIRLLERFASVFDGTYTRFLDLQKAEAQVREAHIEAALERTRTQSMIMQHSSELDDTLRVFHQQVLLLGIRSAFSFLWLPDEEKDRHIFWAAWAENNSSDFNSKAIDYPLDRNEPATAQCLVDWKGNDPVVSYRVPPEGVAGYFAAWQELIDGVEQLKPEYFKGGLYYVEAFMKYGCFGVMVESALSPEESKILGRFAIEFERTYTRFLDLQKAEAQAREAQIELSLERVRAKTMAMHNSNDVGDTVVAMFDELVKLGVETLRCGILINSDRDKMEVWTASSAQNAGVSMIIGRLDMNIHPLLKGIYHAWAEKRSFFTYDLDGEDMVNYYTAINSLPDYPVRFDIKALPGKQVHSDFFFPEGAIFAFTKDPIPAPSVQIFKRFAGVFGQTYRRYLDLQRAEAQARESQIELALERVRARTMAMQKSEELKEIIKVVYEQLIHLNILAEHAGFIMDYRANDDMHIWLADKHFDPSYVTVPYFDSPHWNSFVEAKKKGTDFFANLLTFEEKNKFYQQLFELVPGVTDEAREFYLNCPGLAGSTVLLDNVGLYIENFSGIPYTDEENSTLMRFGKVFQQTYTRFLDLQKAEAQAREAQIEAALERVRSRTMGMQQSAELQNAALLLFQQAETLGVKAFACGFNIWDDDRKFATAWMGSVQGLQPPFKTDSSKDVYLPIYNAAKNGEPLFLVEQGGKGLVAHYQYLATIPTFRDVILKNWTDAGVSPPTFQIIHCAFFAQGYLMFISHEPCPEAYDIFKRFAKVFEQTYTRFKDLEQAEEQARESQIQLALERVRARTMAMQHSDELAETAAVLFQQFFALGVSPDRVFIATFREESSELECWTTDQEGSRVSNRFVASLKQPSFAKMYKAWQSQKRSFTLMQTGKELSDYISYLKDEIGIPFKKGVKIEQRVQNVGFFSKGLIGMTTPDVQPPEMTSLVERFATVFDLAYTRFNDLKQAEEQARESKIEAALEKVRGKALAMYSSADLTSTASMVFTELRKLGINPIRCGVGMMNNKSRKVALYSATTSVAGDGLGLVGWVMLSDHPVLDKIYDSLLSGEDYFPVLKGQQLKAYYGKLLSGLSLPTLPDFHPGEEQFGHFFPFADGCLYAWAEKAYNDIEIRILKRFASVIDLTFRRYIELQKSETSAREAVRAASLDRVRAEIASMRSTEDLDRITPLIWNELTILGIPFIRCGVFIVDERAKLIYTHLSTADGRAISTFNLPFNAEGIGEQVLTAWRAKQVATLHWTAEEFAYNTNNLVSRGTVTSTDRYVTEHPDISLDLHFAPFLQGMLYVGNTSPLTTDELDLVQSLADAFSTAYARYEDFNKLEAAKQQVENTLTDLKAAQTKLIQSEKMASLGELTAGIAHEIQNPLNFVNNFSEVNQEMIDELEEELRAGNIEDALVIAADIKQNEQKINHHGKRADGIVKGMLQHSRTGGGEKQPTNINALADEFMRLAYHGLRAKDKVFNADLITHFDPDLPKINVIGQDIGRVLLNLFNNAFYAVNQKKKALGGDFKPEVTVTTMTENGQVIVKVKDNGVGMPENVKEKIMQPFFTTKPTGDGTGLGLSLTYDMVVKGHGGTIQVNSVEGEGSEFIIKLPILT